MTYKPKPGGAAFQWPTHTTIRFLDPGPNARGLEYVTLEEFERRKRTYAAGPVDCKCPLCEANIPVTRKRIIGG